MATAAYDVELEYDGVTYSTVVDRDDDIDSGDPEELEILLGEIEDEARQELATDLSLASDLGFDIHALQSDAGEWELVSITGPSGDELLTSHDGDLFSLFH